MIRLTIIMPVYNAESYVVRALDSIPKRDDIEVICIDDCSTDNTADILSKYDRIPLRLFKTEVNSGPGVARNIGYDNAQGEYIYGLDSDDTLNTDIFNKVLDQFDMLTKYDLIHVLIRTNYNTIGNTNCSCDAVHTYMIRRSFLGDLRMPSIRRSEDKEFLDTIKAKNPNKILLNAIMYNYNFPREGSITWNYRHGKVDGYGNEVK